MALKDLDELPFPDFTIFGTHRLSYYPLITSRGCPFSCKYCFRSLKGDWRPRLPGNVIAEIEHAKETYQFRHIVIHDDSFNLNPRRVRTNLRSHDRSRHENSLEVCRYSSESGDG